MTKWYYFTLSLISVQIKSGHRWEDANSLKYLQYFLWDKYEFILTNKSKSSLKFEVGVYLERQNSKLKINSSPLLWMNYAYYSKQILLRWFSHNPLVLWLHAEILCIICTKMYKRLFLRYKYAYAKPSTVRLNHLYIFCNRKIKRWQGASN